MKRKQREKRLHGVRAVVPSRWEDHTAYRFVAPAVDPPAESTSAAEEQIPTFCPCLMVTRHQVPADLSLEELFAAPNRAASDRYGVFEVLRAGSAPYQEQAAAWQDVRFKELPGEPPAYQRQIAVRSAPEELVLLTLTSSRDALDELGREIGFSPSGEPPQAPTVDKKR